MLPLPRQMPYEGYIVDKDYNVCKEINAGDEVRIRRASQVEHNKQYIKLNPKITFAKLFCKATDILSMLHFTGSETQIIFAMLSHIGFGEYSGYLIKIQCNMFAGYLYKNDLREIVPMNEKTFDRAIDGLVEKEIIQLEKDGRNYRILVNPFIFAKGTEITRTLYEKFEDSIFNAWKK